MRAQKGSQKWIQYFVNDEQGILNRKISESLRIKNPYIKWISPIREDSYAEYKDEVFLEKLGLSNLIDHLELFWPKNGPNWDALAINEESQYFLVEAKANTKELTSSCRATDNQSVKLISKSISLTKKHLEVEEDYNWLKGSYQYVNRLAHLFFLRELHNVDAYLIMVYFINDYTHIKTSMKEWTVALSIQKSLLGLSANHPLECYIGEVFIDIKSYKGISQSCGWNIENALDCIQINGFHLFECGGCGQPLILPEVGNFPTAAETQKLNNFYNSGGCPKCSCALRRI